MSNYRFLNFELSESDFSLTCDGQRIALEPKALRVLTLLVARAGRLVEKREVLENVWPDTFVEENTLTRTIANLRRQLGDSSRDSKLIETVPTKGYRFIATVEIVPERGTVFSLSSSVSTGNLAASLDPILSPAYLDSAPLHSLPAITDIPLDPMPDAAAYKTERRSSLKIVGLLIALSLGVAVLYGWLGKHRHPRPDDPIRSLAVLPLEDLSPGAKEDYFADGMTDELITELAHIPVLRVVSRTSIMQDKGVRKSLPQIARELGVDAIVEGSVVRSGDRVRITAQLIDARSDRHLWAQSFEAPLGDILSLQDDVAREIAAQTSSVLTPAARTDLTKAKHLNPEGHDAYLRGLYFIQRREGKLAATYFQKAIELDPGYAAAYAGLAESLVTQFLTEGASDANLIPSAIQSARKAIELDPHSGEAYTALGAVETTYLYEWSEAEKNLRKGIELNPSSSDAQTWYAVFLTSVGRPQEAVTTMRMAVSLNPLSFWANRLLGSMLFYSRQYEESLIALKRSLELAPDKVQFVEGWNSGDYELLGRYDDAFASDMRLLSAEHPKNELALFRRAFETAGWTGYQQARVKYLLPKSSTDCYMDPLALSYLRLNEITEAFRWLSRSLDNRCGTAVFDLSSDPRLDTIRNDPRLAELLRRAKLPYRSALTLAHESVPGH